MKDLKIGIIGFLLFQACHKETPTFITGTWNHTYYDANSGLNRVDHYQFEENGDYKRYLLFQDPGTKEYLGYGYFQSGTFWIEESELSLFTNRSLLALEAEFATFENLSEQEAGFSSIAIVHLLERDVLKINLGPCQDPTPIICAPTRDYERADG
jgi:hypothetical protein